MLVGCVGGIRNGHVANEILEKGQADVVLLGSAFLKNPGSVLAFAEDLEVDTYLANQWEWGTSKLHPLIKHRQTDFHPFAAFKGRGSHVARQDHKSQSASKTRA